MSDFLHTDHRSVIVVIPMPSNPDWSLFDAIPPGVPVLVVDDSGGRLSPAPRDGVRVLDERAQRELCGDHYDAMPKKSAASRNVGHYAAFLEGFEIIVALDYDCRTRPGWLQEHLTCLDKVVHAPARRGHWLNSVETPGTWARGYPYEFRNATASAVEQTRTDGEIKLNMGVWDGVLDLNGIDKLASAPALEPGLSGEQNLIALGKLPLCGMNTSFAAELVPAYFFLPDVRVDGWQLSRHDDIWGGYVLQSLMSLRGDLVSWGRPVVEHTRQTPLERVVVMEHWMHLMSLGFYDCVDAAAERVVAASYQDMFSAFVAEFLAEVDRSSRPEHYRDVYRSLGRSMAAWSRAFPR